MKGILYVEKKKAKGRRWKSQLFDTYTWMVKQIFLLIFRVESKEEPLKTISIMMTTCVNNIFNYSRWYNIYGIYISSNNDYNNLNNLLLIRWWLRVNDIYSKELLLFSNIITFFFPSILFYLISFIDRCISRWIMLKTFARPWKRHDTQKWRFRNNSWKVQFIYFRKRILLHFCILIILAIEFQISNLERKRDIFFSFFFFPLNRNYLWTIFPSVVVDDVI